MKSLCFALLAVSLTVAAMVCVCSQHQHGPNEAHSTEVDLEFGQYTKEQIREFESRKPDSSLSTKTHAANLDGGHSNDVLTIVIDFKDSSQPTTSDVIGNFVGEFEVDEFGFSASDFQMVVDSIMAEVQEDFFTELAGTVANENGMDLEINIIEGDIGTPPPGVSEFYYIQVGTGESGPFIFALGVAAGSSVRNSSGDGPNNGIEIGDVVASVFTDNIQGIGGLDPSNALSSGNIEFSRNAVVGTLSHEIGHVLSLSHVNNDMSVQPTSDAAPIMGTGAIDLPNQLRITDREFTLTGFNEQNGNAQVFHIQQMVDAVGLDASLAGPLDNISLTINAGTESGGLAELENDDSQVVSVLAAAVDVPVQFEVVADSPTLQPPSLNLTFEPRSNTPNVNQTIELFNFNTGVFDVVDQRAVGTDFETTVLDLNTNTFSFIDPANCQIRCRVSYEPTGPVVFFPWKIELDQLVFEISE